MPPTSGKDFNFFDWRLADCGSEDWRNENEMHPGHNEQV